jgi:MULE transposase domain
MNLSNVSSPANSSRRSSNAVAELSASLGRGEIVRRLSADGSLNLVLPSQEISARVGSKKGSDVVWKKEKPKNYKLVSLREDDCKHLVLVDDDKCLWKCYRLYGNKAYMSCTNEKLGERRNCPARGSILDGMFQRSATSSHNHDNDHEEYAAGLIKYTELKKEVYERRRTNVRVIWREWIRGLSQVQKAEYAWSKVRSALFSIRNSILPSCPSQNVLSNLLSDNEDVKENYGMFGGKRFYQGMHGGSFVFVPSALLGNKVITGDFYADATFGITPLNFSQLMIVKATVEGELRPVAYILMNKKSQEAYEDVFKVLDALNFKPSTLMLDFEQATINAARVIWKDITIHGCYFHFCQALWKNAVDKIKMQKRKAEKCSIVKMYMRLALLPLDKIIEGIDAILEVQRAKHLSTEFEIFHTYFVKQWVAKQSGWCVYGLKIRTNNTMETYNHAIKVFCQRQPNVYIFLDSLLDMVYETELTLLADMKKARLLNAAKEAETSGKTLSKPPKITKEFKSRSKLTPLLEVLIPKLLSSKISVKQFLQQLAVGQIEDASST